MRPNGAVLDAPIKPVPPIRCHVGPEPLGRDVFATRHVDSSAMAGAIACANASSPAGRPDGCPRNVRSGRVMQIHRDFVLTDHDVLRWRGGSIGRNIFRHRIDMRRLQNGMSQTQFLKMRPRDWNCDSVWWL